MVVMGSALVLLLFGVCIACIGSSEQRKKHHNPNLSRTHLKQTISKRNTKNLMGVLIGRSSNGDSHGQGNYRYPALWRKRNETFDPTKMPNFFNDDYDPNSNCNSNCNSNYNRKSPFNKTAFEEYNRQWKDYMQKKYNSNWNYTWPPPKKAKAAEVSIYEKLVSLPGDRPEESNKRNVSLEGGEIRGGIRTKRTFLRMNLHLDNYQVRPLTSWANTPSLQQPPAANVWTKQPTSQSPTRLAIKSPLETAVTSPLTSPITSPVATPIKASVKPSFQQQLQKVRRQQALLHSKLQQKHPVIKCGIPSLRCQSPENTRNLQTQSVSVNIGVGKYVDDVISGQLLGKKYSQPPSKNNNHVTFVPTNPKPKNMFDHASPAASKILATKPKLLSLPTLRFSGVKTNAGVASLLQRFNGTVGVHNNVKKLDKDRPAQPLPKQPTETVHRMVENNRAGLNSEPLNNHNALPNNHVVSPGNHVGPLANQAKLWFKPPQNPGEQTKNHDQSIQHHDQVFQHRVVALKSHPGSSVNHDKSAKITVKPTENHHRLFQNHATEHRDGPSISHAKLLANHNGLLGNHSVKPYAHPTENHSDISQQHETESDELNKKNISHARDESEQLKPNYNPSPSKSRERSTPTKLQLSSKPSKPTSSVDPSKLENLAYKSDSVEEAETPARSKTDKKKKKNKDDSSDKDNANGLAPAPRSSPTSKTTTPVTTPEIPSYLKLLYGPDYNPFNRSSWNSSTFKFPKSPFYNSDYDPMDMNSKYATGGESPFNKTAYEQFQNGFREYMKQKYNVSIPTPPAPPPAKGANGKMPKYKKITPSDELTFNDNNGAGKYKMITAGDQRTLDENNGEGGAGNANDTNHGENPSNAEVSSPEPTSSYAKPSPTAVKSIAKPSTTSIKPSPSSSKLFVSSATPPGTTVKPSSTKASISDIDNFDPNAIPNFYNDDYDPSSNNNSKYNNRSPFNKTAFKEYSRKFNEYMENKYNISGKNKASPSNKTKPIELPPTAKPQDISIYERLVSTDPDSNTSPVNGKRAANDGSSQSADEDSSATGRSSSNNTSQPMYFFGMPSFYNSADYPTFDYKGPFNKTAFMDFSNKLKKYIQERMNRYKSSQSQPNNNTPQESKDNTDKVKNETESPNSETADSPKGNAKPKKADKAASENAGKAASVNNTAASNAAASTSAKPSSETERAVPESEKTNLVNEKPGSISETSAAGSEKSTSDISQSDKPDKPASEAGYTDKQEEEDIKAITEEQTKPTENSKAKESPAKDNDYELMEDKASNNGASPEQEESHPEEIKQPEPAAIVDNTPAVESMSKVQDGLTSTSKNESSSKCHIGSGKCSTEQSEKEMVIVLQVDKPKNCIQRKHKNHQIQTNSVSNSGSTNGVTVTDVTPVVVINNDPYKAFDRRKQKKTELGVRRNHYHITRGNHDIAVKRTNMGSLRELESLMREPTSPIIRLEEDGKPATSLADIGEEEDCKATFEAFTTGTDSFDPSVISTFCSGDYHLNSNNSSKRNRSESETVNSLTDKSNSTGEKQPPGNKQKGLVVNNTTAASETIISEPETSTSEINQLDKPEKSTTEVDLRIKEVEVENKVKVETKPANKTESSHFPAKDSDNELMEDKAPRKSLLSDENEGNREEGKKHASSAAIVDSNPSDETMSNAHGSLVDTRNNQSSPNCSTENTNCTTEQTEPDMVVVLQVNKPKKCFPRIGTNRTTRTNSVTNDRVRTNDNAETDVTPVVVINNNPYKAFDRRKHKKRKLGVKRNHYSVSREASVNAMKRTNMESLGELESLMVEPTSPIIRLEKYDKTVTSLADIGEEEDCKATCTC